MNDKPKSQRTLAGLAAAVFCCWCLFWMLQPAAYWAGIAKWKWLGLPAQYAFWLIGMVIVVPASCFLFTLWANRRRPASDAGRKSREAGETGGS